MHVYIIYLVYFNVWRLHNIIEFVIIYVQPFRLSRVFFLPHNKPHVYISGSRVVKWNQLDYIYLSVKIVHKCAPKPIARSRKPSKATSWSPNCCWPTKIITVIRLDFKVKMNIPRNRYFYDICTYHG